MPKNMRRVIIESPYAGEVERNVAYARLALLDCMRRGEAPIASHLLITQVYDDLIDEERKAGISAGLAWYHASDVTGVFFIDFGYSNGMAAAKKYLIEHGIPYEERSIEDMPEFRDVVALASWNQRTPTEPCRCGSSYGPKICYRDPEFPCHMK